MADYTTASRGHVTRIEEVPRQFNREWGPKYVAVCDTCEWRFGQVTYRSEALRMAVQHVEAHRPPPPSWAARGHRPVSRR